MCWLLSVILCKLIWWRHHVRRTPAGDHSRLRARKARQNRTPLYPARGGASGASSPRVPRATRRIEGSVGQTARAPAWVPGRKGWREGGKEGNREERRARKTLRHTMTSQSLCSQSIAFFPRFRWGVQGFVNSSAILRHHSKSAITNQTWNSLREAYIVPMIIFFHQRIVMFTFSQGN